MTCSFRKFCLLSTLILVIFPKMSLAIERNPRAVSALIERVGGKGAARRFTTIIDETLSADGRDCFSIGSQKGKPLIKGNSVSALTFGFNWYLNHYASINLCWNNPTADLLHATLPLPESEEKHACRADYRYYLNYCTFSYTASTWTWQRWAQEIDWMALHGINMPLQIVGLDVVWKKLLTSCYGYSEEEAGRFIAGPCFQAWWGMNNLEAWGGPNPSRWYARQERLAKQILARERELGMTPVLPGFSGMVPSDFTSHTGIPSNEQGLWCGFVRPAILDPNTPEFEKIATQYYAVLKQVMGTSKYYSMDPFHEGANTKGINVPQAYKRLAEVLERNVPNADWVIQMWQWTKEQYKVLDNVAQGKLIILDLFADAHSHFETYKGHDAVFCMLHNFGGRTGFYGRFDGLIDSYFDAVGRYSNVRGIGATPEALESVPMLYDLLYELAWMEQKPDGKTWLQQYAARRYGEVSSAAQAAWERLRISALACSTDLQGPHEAVVCARPSYDVKKVSSWGGTDIFYDPQDVDRAAYDLLEASLSGRNYSYDLTDLSRQALTDYSFFLLQSIRKSREMHHYDDFNTRKKAFLRLILDIDRLLGTNEMFRLGRWTESARQVADEMPHADELDRMWLEQNARTLISTWGGRRQAGKGGLHDYSYRQWEGMLRDYYLPRWDVFFRTNDPNRDWFEQDSVWANNFALFYSPVPEGNSHVWADRLLHRYIFPLVLENGQRCFIYRHVETERSGEMEFHARRGKDFVLPISLPSDAQIDFRIAYEGSDDPHSFMTSETTLIQIPENIPFGKHQASLSLKDGTFFTFTVIIE